MQYIKDMTKASNNLKKTVAPSHNSTYNTKENAMKTFKIIKTKTGYMLISKNSHADQARIQEYAEYPETVIQVLVNVGYTEVI